MHVAGGIHADGADADALRVEGGALDLRDTQVSANTGVAIRMTGEARGPLSGVHARGARGDVVVER